jgi:hypothetical protein
MTRHLPQAASVSAMQAILKAGVFLVAEHTMQSEHISRRPPLSPRVASQCVSNTS